MKLNEKDIIRLIFIIFIIIGFIVLIWNYNKNVIEGATNIGSGCNDCRITPEYSSTNSLHNYILNQGNSTIAANYASGAGISGDFLNNYFGNKGRYCQHLDLNGVDGSYVFCPWQPGNVPKNLSECNNNTVFGSTTGSSQYSTSTYNNSFCCSNTDSNNNFYIDNYLLLNDVSKIYGLVFEVDNLSTTTITNATGMEISQNLYEFKNPTFQPTTGYTVKGFDISVNIYQSSKSSNTSNPDKYINCKGDEISFNNLDNVAYISKACQKLYPNIGYGNYTIEQGVNFCMQSAQYCEISNVMTDCSLLLPKYTPSNEWYRISPEPGAQASPVGGFDIDGSIQTGLQSAVDQLVSKFTQQITSLTSQIGESLQFPNLGQVKYLDVGACNNNAPYVYNSGCDTSLGYLGQYTCYPSLTGAFSDCGPPGYDAKPQF